MPFSCSIKFSYVFSYFSALLRRTLGCSVQSSDPPTHGALPATRCPLPPSSWGSPPISGRHVSRTGSIFGSTISSTSEGQLGKTCKCSRTSPIPFVSSAVNSKSRIPTQDATQKRSPPSTHTSPSVSTSPVTPRFPHK